MFRHGLRRAYFTPFGGTPFPEFTPRPVFNFDNHPHWFIGHMSKGKRKIQQRLKDVDVLLEVRDARAPFASAQTDVLFELGPHVRRMVVLNKADLVTPTVGMAARRLIEEAGTPCLLTNACENKNLIKIKQFAMDNCRARFPRSLGLMLMVIGLPNVGKSTIVNGLKRIAFSTARRQGKESKLMHNVKWTEAKTNSEPGATRDVNFFQLSNFPRLYCYDTPGISLLKVRHDPERNTKLALIKTMPDHLSGEMYLADYLLYRLNKEELFDYVDVLELPGPTDDVRILSAWIFTYLAERKTNQVKVAHPNAGATFFLNLWRTGQLGKLCLDHIPDPEEMQKLRVLRTQTEPPGPWGPPKYPDAPLGLELDSLRDPRAGCR